MKFILSMVFYEVFKKFFESKKIHENKTLDTQSTQNEQSEIVCDIGNYGNAALQGEWVYYSNLFDGCSLYKIRIDGSEKSKLYSDYTTSIKLTENWVYYVSDKYPESYFNKIRIDGTDQFQLFKMGDLILIDIIDKWFYFKERASIIRVYEDGTNKELISDNASNSIRIDRNWIYYADDAGIFKISTDGLDKKQLEENKCTNIFIYDDWIYYERYDDWYRNEEGYKERGSYYIYRMRIDGSKIMKLCKGQNMIVADDWIYYCSVSDHQSLCKIYKDGTNKLQIIEGNGKSSNIKNIIGDWIYYSNFTDYDYYKIRIDGTGKKNCGPIKNKY